MAYLTPAYAGKSVIAATRRLRSIVTKLQVHFYVKVGWVGNLWPERYMLYCINGPDLAHKTA